MELQQLHTRNGDAFVGFVESRIGGRKENQDSYGFSETPWGFLVTVCDGMGGGPGGKTASTIAVKEIIAGVNEASKDEEIANIIIKAIRRANMAIIEAANETPSLMGMGSTATVLLLSEQSAIVAFVGDSRVYQVRGRRKIFRTFDHSMVFDLVKQGVITEEQARLSAQSNVITRALGITPDVQVDLHELAYEKGDRFVLCTDGIHGTMPEKELLKLFGNRKTALGAVTDDIATYVDNLGRSSHNGHDNLTIAIVETKINSKLRPQMSKQTKFTLMVLVAVCLISIAINILQAVTSGKHDAQQEQRDSVLVAQKDSIIGTLQKSDSVLKDSIKRLNSDIAKTKDKIREAIN